MKDESIRAFIAIELPTWLKERLGSEIASLRAILGSALLRWVRPEAIHLTLRFLGDTSPKTLDEVGAALRRLCGQHPPFGLEIAGLGRFPKGARPRVLWIGVEEPSGALDALQVQLESLVIEFGFHPEDRPFHPHLTLARVRRQASKQALRDLAEQMDQAQVGRLGRLEVAQLALMRSVLAPSGASYSRLQQFDLAGAG